MSRAKALAFQAAWIGGVVAPVAFAFHRGMAGAPAPLRLVAVGLAVALLLCAGPALLQGLRDLGRRAVGLLLATLLVGAALSGVVAPRPESAAFAEVVYSDGRREAGIRPAPVSAWGRELPGYALHPAFDGAVVPDSLVATFPSQPTQVKLLFAKPREALHSPDGALNASDGVSVEAVPYDAEGAPGPTSRFDLSQDAFLSGQWIERSVASASGIATLKVSVGWGLPGSTANFDTTLVAFEVSTWKVHVERLGRLLLLCLGVFMAGLMVLSNLAPARSVATGRRAAWPQVALVVAGLVLLAGWSQANTSYIYFWDYRNYWDSTERLHALLAAGDWRAALGLFGDRYTGNYSLLPAVLPALLGLVAGGPTRVGFAVGIVALYAVPAYLLVAWLGRRLLDGRGDTGGARPWALAAFPVLVGLPAFLGTTLYLMPDIGGVVLVVAALLSASRLVEAIEGRGGGASGEDAARALFKASVSLGVLLGLMFVFRRWYLFSAAGIACGVACLVLAQVWRSPASRRAMLARTFSAVVLVGASALPLLCWFLFAWSRDLAQYDYANLYASYRVPPLQDVETFARLFGIVVPLLCAVGGLIAWRGGQDRRLLFLLAFSTLVAVALFLGVQSPGRHHYFLLMPLMGATLAVVALALARRFGVAGMAGFTLLLAVGGLLSTPSAPGRTGISPFAGFEDLRPRQQANAEGLRQVSRWLARPENRDRKFCLVASSVAINQGNFRELWQLFPDVGRNAYDARMVRLGQVDSLDGPPVPGLMACELFLVGVPFQYHLQRDQQYSLEIIQSDIVDGTGIGAAMAPDPEVFAMGEGVELRAYRTARAISTAQHEDLVRRYQARKAAPE
ncbi:hypothetical protein [Arenimonas sp.]|uniref:hypothetical protein n=1 Tax=Arenimonas sp. TaxID=1872635 RepID=UPI002E36A458|nr:hypothetical protein [Arenimonas sp.]HEX4854992.1 hypothetical protein [Arenimonas sp.]